jgi:hypothetical protein
MRPLPIQLLLMAPLFFLARATAGHSAGPAHAREHRRPMSRAGQGCRSRSRIRSLHHTHSPHQTYLQTKSSLNAVQQDREIGAGSTSTHSGNSDASASATTPVSGVAAAAKSLKHRRRRRRRRRRRHRRRSGPRTRARSPGLAIGCVTTATLVTPAHAQCLPLILS